MSIRVSVKDKEAFKAIQPDTLEAYLTEKGWIKAEPHGPYAYVWKLPETEYKVLVPVQNSLRDYILRVADIINTLEEIEGRTQLEILCELDSKPAKELAKLLLTRLMKILYRF